MYITFVRPILEYASVVWDGCAISDLEKLEKVQLHAARIVTGLSILASKESLYFETGWEPLNERRRKAKLITMYKMHHNTVPQYLCDTIVNFRKNVQYSTRNEENYIIPKCRTEIFKKSFIPDVICKWNALPNEVIKSSSISQFRRSISNMVKNRISILENVS